MYRAGDEASSRGQDERAENFYDYANKNCESEMCPNGVKGIGHVRRGSICFYTTQRTMFFIRSNGNIGEHYSIISDPNVYKFCKGRLYDNKPLARVVANWCKKYLNPEVLSDAPQLADWHFWGIN